MNDILLLTSSVISDKCSSWLLLKKITSYVGKQNVVVYSINGSKYNHEEDINIIHRYTWLKSSFVRKLINKTQKKFTFKIDKFISKRVYKDIIHIIKKENIKILWIYSDIIPLLVVEKLVRENVNIPFHVSVFDDPLTNINFFMFEPLLNQCVKLVLSKCKSIDVSSQYLFDKYVENGIIKDKLPFGITYGGEFRPIVTNNKTEIRQYVKKICLTGNIFGIESFITFIKSIKPICLEQNIFIDIYSNADSLSLLSLKYKFGEYSNFISFKPFVNEIFLDRLLLEYDLLLLPVSFSNSEREIAKSSFPSKTHNYLHSAVPILLFSPKYAGIYNFLVEKKLCSVIDSDNPLIIKKEFEMALDYDNRKKISANIYNFSTNNEINTHMLFLSDVIKSC